jgi:hypothetical protein
LSGARLFSLIGPIRKKADIFSFVPTTDRNNIKIWQISNRKIFSSDISRWERGKKKKKSGGVCAGAVASGDQR